MGQPESADQGEKSQLQQSGPWGKLVLGKETVGLC